MSTRVSAPPPLLRRTPWSVRPGGRPWPPATQWLLIGIGAVLAAVTFLGVLSMPDLPYHPARDLELTATYDSYRATGVPLIKQSGTGSWYGSTDGTGLTRAAGDDDPGSYLVASWMSHLTGSASPYTGLRWAMAMLCALPLLLLPLTVARVFKRARAGVAVLALPAVMWLINKGTVLIGTEYGLSDSVSPVRVYALYGMAASMVFLSLVLLAHLSTHRLPVTALIAWSTVVVLLASVSNLLRSMSGIGIALALGVLWWSAWHRRGRAAVVAVAVVAGVIGSLVVPSIVMERIDRERRTVISESAELPDAHGLWHPLYLGLSYPQPITGEESPFGIVWSDEFGWSQAREIDPGVVVASADYDAIIKDLYLEQVRDKPGSAVRLYVEKTLYTIKQFAAMLVLIVLGLALALRRPGQHRRSVGLVAAVSAPTLVFGMLPPVIVMPMLYYYSELVAALGLLSALALGGLVWAYTTLPSYVRVDERRRRSERFPVTNHATGRRMLSVVVPSRNGVDVLPGTLSALGDRLSSSDEIVVVENGSTDDTTRLLESVVASWRHPCALQVLHSQPGLGNALRTGVLATSGSRLLLSADDLPFGLSDLEGFELLPEDVTLAIGSKAHPDSRVDRSWRRTVQSRVFRRLREALLHSAVADSQGTIWVDGEWARGFAAVSREAGLMWTVELVLAAEQQGFDVYEIPVTLSPSHDGVGSRFRVHDAVVGVQEIWQLALRKDDYAATESTTPGRALARRARSSIAP